MIFCKGNMVQGIPPRRRNLWPHKALLGGRSWVTLDMIRVFMSEDLGPLSLSGTLDSFYLGSCKIVLGSQSCKFLRFLFP